MSVPKPNVVQLRMFDRYLFVYSSKAEHMKDMISSFWAEADKVRVIRIINLSFSVKIDCFATLHCIACYHMSYSYLRPAKHLSLIMHRKSFTISRSHQLPSLLTSLMVLPMLPTDRVHRQIIRLRQTRLTLLLYPCWNSLLCTSMLHLSGV